ncbi:FolC bifunctional protein [Delitschia confertaspora ATCC 74209]|uniref:FolC bifunctional protein n=1 Tax=Delitschia confertaspora ATCC 74209 TaxID=1513339 RepID=A0A9P4JC36_9PLEO|nr:FolC bifunctional protein [Delitschia confertaspora ATCC 74209]
MIQPGLERISLLLKGVPLRWKSIHVAGTNGKGSICGYMAAMLRQKQIKTGLFTSPHLMDRWDCICIDQKPVEKRLFDEVEQYFLSVNRKRNIQASEFEILTATAFKIFTEERVEFGIVEVGMGGELDATNVLQNQIISVIGKIGLDHQQYLGTTLEEIAKHKAGILRRGVRYIVNPRNSPRVLHVIDEYAKSIGAGPRIDVEADRVKKTLYSTTEWLEGTHNLAQFQKENAAIALNAVMDALITIGEHSVQDLKLVKVLSEDSRVPGRVERKSINMVFGEQRIILDGAHNEDAAIELSSFLDEGRRGEWSNNLHRQVMRKVGEAQQRAVLFGNRLKTKPITWILAMSAGRDPRTFLSHLLAPGDSVVTVEFGPVEGMPWVKPQPSSELLRAAKDVEPSIIAIDRGTDTLRALYTAKHLLPEDGFVVVTGSLYLVGDVSRLARDLMNPGQHSIVESDGMAAKKASREISQEIDEQRRRLDEEESEAVELLKLDHPSGTEATALHPSTEILDFKHGNTQEELFGNKPSNVMLDGEDGEYHTRVVEPAWLDTPLPPATNGGQQAT